MADPLTVGQLIGLLEEVEDKSLPIYSEGCDCVEKAFTIDLYEDGIIIERQFDIRPVAEPRPTLEELTDQAMGRSPKGGDTFNG